MSEATSLSPTERWLPDTSHIWFVLRSNGRRNASSLSKAFRSFLLKPSKSSRHSGFSASLRAFSASTAFLKLCCNTMACNEAATTIAWDASITERPTVFSIPWLMSFTKNSSTLARRLSNCCPVSWNSPSPSLCMNLPSTGNDFSCSDGDVRRRWLKCLFFRDGRCAQGLAFFQYGLVCTMGISNWRSSATRLKSPDS